MNKTFLYLYPIKENFEKITTDYIDNPTSFLESLKLLNNCIQTRYRDKGYKVVIALYYDKNIYGIIPKKEDKIILTDVSFKESRTEYPNEIILLDKLGSVDNLIIGGFHFNDCIIRVGEQALSNGINTLVDLDLTDLFFTLCKSDYFNIEEYNQQRYMENWIKEELKYVHNEETVKKQFYKMYDSKIYGFLK